MLFDPTCSRHQMRQFPTTPCWSRWMDICAYTHMQQDWSHFSPGTEDTVLILLLLWVLPDFILIFKQKSSSLLYFPCCTQLFWLKKKWSLLNLYSKSMFEPRSINVGHFFSLGKEVLQNLKGRCFLKISPEFSHHAKE